MAATTRRTWMDMPDQSGSSKQPFNWIGCAIGVVILVGAIYLFWPMHGGKDSARNTACLSYTKQMAIASLMYAGDHDDHLPLRDSWMDAITPLAKNNTMMFQCPTLYSKGRDENIYGYAFYGPLSGALVPKQPETVPLVFDSLNLARNASGTLESAPKPGRHATSKGPRNSVAYADGHVSRVE